MDTSLTRRTVAKLTALVAAGGSALLGWVLDAFQLEQGEAKRTAPDASGEAGDSAAELPPPHTSAGDKRVGRAIADRRSRREFGPDPLSAGELGQLLWAAQGITERHPTDVDFRAAPSAGATYPLEVFVVIGEPGVTGFEAGIFQYDPQAHGVDQLEEGSYLSELATIAIDQDWVEAAALAIVITGIDERTTQRYGSRGRRRYVPMEAGHVGENIYLQCESLGLSTVAIGAFRDSALRDLLDVPDSHRPLYIYPVGKRATVA